MKKTKIAALVYLVIYFFLDVSSLLISSVLSAIAIVITIWLWSEQ